jgi:rare lipoprotein A
MRRIGALALAVLLAGCAGAPPKAPEQRRSAPAPAPAARSDLPALPAAGSGRGGYYKDDGPGENPPPNLRDVPDAEVKAEAPHKYANRPYEVFGKTYTPMAHGAPFVQRGVASWYGKKFHGQRTSSGELYDMYKMTAAHPTLPIPSYARVTSIGNGQSVVVRVNDRGPFHASRIIDVSYTAALKLGLLGKGSHEVRVERVLPGDAARAAADEGIQALILENRDPDEMKDAAKIAPQAAPQAGFYVQLGSFNSLDKAVDIREQADGAEGLDGELDVVRAGSLYRVFSGPYDSREAAERAARAVPTSLRLKPIVVRR